jgi:hypothetical protein
MHRYAAATALVIALITVLTPAVSKAAGGFQQARNEGECDGLMRRPDWPDGGRTGAIRCHCMFECRRQHGSTVTVPCASNDVAFWSLTRALQRQHEGLCDVRIVPLGAFGACWKTCVNATKAAQH